MLTPSGTFTILALAMLFGCGFAACGQTQIDPSTQARNTPTLSGNNLFAGSNDFSGALNVLLPLPWISNSQPNTYTAGATQTFQGSLENAAFGIAAQSDVPTKIQAGQFFLTLMGLLGLFDGSGANMFVMFQGTGKQTPAAPSAGKCVEWSSTFFLVASTLPCSAPVTAVNPGCAAVGDIGKQWLDNTSSATTHFRVCAAVASVPSWVTVF